MDETLKRKIDKINKYAVYKRHFILKDTSKLELKTYMQAVPRDSYTLTSNNPNPELLLETKKNIL